MRNMDKFLSLIPFILISKGNGDGPDCHNSEPTKINAARIIEALIISAVAGIVAGYISVQKLEVKLDYTIQENAKQDKRMEDTRLEYDRRCTDILGKIDKLSDVMTRHIVRDNR